MKALIFALALFACVAPAAAAPPNSVPGSGSLVFGIWRSGTRIGAHSYAFRAAGDDLIVEQRIELAVRVAFVTLYHYTSKRLEVWRNGHIVRYESDADQAGKHSDVRGRAGESGLRIRGSAGNRDLPADAMPFGLWNRAALRGVPVFNADDGTPMKLDVTIVEDDMLSRYHVGGEVNYMLSYINDVLRGVSIVAPDGSTVEYVPE